MLLVRSGTRARVLANLAMASGLLVSPLWPAPPASAAPIDSPAVAARAPDQAPSVTSADYGADPDRWYGGVGRTGTFTFGSNGASDVAGYQWGWSETMPHRASVPAGGSLSVALTPPPPTPSDPTAAGRLTLFVRSYGTSGRTSPLLEYRFNVGPATAAAGAWKLDEPAGSTSLADTSGRDHAAAVVGAVPGVPGRILGGPGRTAPTATSFDGNDDHAATTEPVLDTAGSFSVSVWVRPRNTDDWPVVLSSAGDVASPFSLRVCTDTGVWCFDTTSADTAEPTTERVRSTQPAKVGVWAHLAAVHDLGARQSRLYVNGVLAAQTGSATTWSGPGGLQLGRERSDGGFGNYFDGDIAEVTVWDRVVSPLEVGQTVTTPVGWWKLDADGADATAYGRDAAVYGPVQWSADRDENPESAVAFDGTPGSYLATSGPVLPTDQSFTIAARFRLSDDGTRASAGTILSMDGSGTSAVRLGYTDADRTWVFSAAGDSVPVDVRSPATAVAGEWTHLAAVYDATTNTMRLYVNGILEATAATTGALATAGPLVIGRGLRDGAHDSWAHGDVDDVRAYHGAMTDHRIAILAG